MGCNITKNLKSKSFLHLLLIIFLILSIIQIIPPEIKLVREASASSIWIDTNWLAPENYSTSEGTDTIPNSGDLKLLYSQGFYVVDTLNYRIVKTNMNGSIWTTYGDSGQFDYPLGIYYDNSTGFIYVADSLNNRIVKTKMGGIGWTTYGSFGSGTGQFKRPSAISYDNSTGYIYVADTYNNRIVKTKMGGTGWTTYGSQGSGTGQFKLPQGVCYDNKDGFIYVADSNNARIVKTKIDGTGWTTYGSAGSGIGQFITPFQIDYNIDTGYVYVVDNANYRIVKTMMNGSGWTNYGSAGSGKGEFHNPHGIAYDHMSGYVYVADTQNHRIVKTMMNGSGWTTFGSVGNGTGQFTQPYGITSYESSYCSDGFLTSRIFDCGAPSNFQSISWVADMPTGTTIKFQFRTGCNLSNITSNDFIGPDGTNSTYYTTSGSTINSSHNGVRLAQYRVNLTTNNLSKTPILKDVTIIYNLLPNQPTLTSPWNNNCTNNNRTTFTWIFNDTDSSFQKAFQWQASAFNDFIEIDYDSAPVISSTSSFIPVSAIPDGFWYWRVRTMDSDDGWGPFSLPWKILIDTISPTSKILFPKNNTIYNKITTLNGEAIDPEISTGLNKVDIAINRLNDDSYWTGQNWVDSESWLKTLGTTKWSYDTSSVIWHSGFKYNIISRATDNATNIEIPKPGKVIIMDFDNVTFSNAIPSFTDVLTTEDVEVGITMADQISGVNASTIEYIISEDAGKTWTRWEPFTGLENGKSVNVTLNLTLPNGTENRIKWRVLDLAGNGPTESKAYQININTWEKVIYKPIIKLWTPLNGSTIPTISVELTWWLVNSNSFNVNYNVYLDTVYPPIELIKPNLIDTSLKVTGLSNQQTYYWTVIPSRGTINGTCESGVWSFIVDVPIPKVKLLTPENGSIINTVKPTLSWSVDYTGTEILKYDVYLDTIEDPGMEHNNYTNKYYISKKLLENGKTYYWKVVPWAGDLKGLESEIWSFTVEKDEIPRFDLELQLEPSVIELEPGSIKYVIANVTNLGDLTDSISVKVITPPNVKLGVFVDDPSTRDIVSGDNAEFNLTIVVLEDAKKAEIIIEVIASSNKALGYDLLMEKQEKLTVKIVGGEKPESERSSYLFVFLNILILIIIIIIILALAIYIHKRKKKEEEEEQEKAAPEAVMVKPIGLPPLITTAPQVAPAPIHPQLPTTTSVTEPPQITQTPPLPQLPPAQKFPATQEQTPTLVNSPHLKAQIPVSPPQHE